MDKAPKTPATKKNKIIAGIVIAFLLILFGHMVGSSGEKQVQTPAGTTYTAAPRAELPDPYVDDQGVAHCQLYIQCAPNPLAVTPVAAVTPQVIDPKVLGNAVDANKARAAAEWNGKTVQITSTVTDISTAFASSVSFGNVTSQSFSLIQIACYVDDESKLIPFTKGQVATVRETVEVGFVGVIKLNDCEFVR